MKSELKSKKRIGLFSTPKVCKFQNNFFDFKFPNDTTLPIVENNELTRRQIYNILWDFLAEDLARQSLTEAEYNETGINNFAWSKIHHTIFHLAEIFAYPLTLKKPNGLGTILKGKSELGFNDKVLKHINSSFKKLEAVNASDTHEKYWPEFFENFNTLRNHFSVFLERYKSRYKNYENIQIYAILESFDIIRSMLTEKQIRQILKAGLLYFENQNYQIYVKYSSLSRLLSTNSYKYEHTETTDYYGETDYYQKITRIIERPSLRIKTSSHYLDIYPDKM